MRKEILEIVSRLNFDDLNDYQFAQVISFYKEENEKSENNAAIQRLLEEPVGQLTDQEREISAKITRENLYNGYFLEICRISRPKNEILQFKSKYAELNNLFFQEENFNEKGRLKNFQLPISVADFGDKVKDSPPPQMIENKENGSERETKTGQGSRNRREVTQGHKLVIPKKKSRISRLKSKDLSSAKANQTSNRENREDSSNFNFGIGLKVNHISEFEVEDYSQENEPNNVKLFHNKVDSNLRNQEGAEDSHKQKRDSKQIEANKEILEKLVQENTILKHETVLLQRTIETVEVKIRELYNRQRPGSEGMISFALSSPSAEIGKVNRAKERARLSSGVGRGTELVNDQKEAESAELELWRIRSKLTSASKLSERVMFLRNRNLKNSLLNNGLETGSIRNSTTNFGKGNVGHLFVDRIYSDINRMLSHSTKKHSFAK